MLNVLDQAWYSEVSSVSVQKVFEPRETIHLQDEPSETVGFILSGGAKAVSYSQAGTQTWLSHFEEGEFFGHISLLTDMPVNFEVSAEGHCVVLLIPVAAMKNLLTKSDSLSRAISKDLALRLDTMMRRFVEALTLSAKGRVCAELMRLSEPIGIDPGKTIIRPNPTFVDLALRISSTRETVSRTVSELQKKGIISRQPGALVVMSPAKLKGAAQ